MHRITSRLMSPLKLEMGISLDVEVETPSQARRTPPFHFH